MTCSTSISFLTGVWIYKMCVCVCVCVCFCVDGVLAPTPISCMPGCHCFQSACQGFSLASKCARCPNTETHGPSLDQFWMLFLLTQHYNFCTFGSPLRDTKLAGHKHNYSYRDCKWGRSSVVCIFNVCVWWFLSISLHLYVVCMYVCIYVCTHVCMYACKWVRAFVWVCACMSEWVVGWVDWGR